MPTFAPTSLRAPWYFGFHDLMPYRVREILLVSSPYDAFTLEEDGRLAERLFAQYSELNLTSGRITHASTGARAMELLGERRFDLVITMVRLEDVDVAAFGRLVKASHPALPVVLLGLNEAVLKRVRGGLDLSAIDGVFVWSGDARILLAIIELVEDRMNVEHDTRLAQVRVILVVEDSVRRYSSFLTLLYLELMTQSSSLIAEGVNDQHKLMRRRARPKILLATTFEQALEYWQKYREYVFALISDVRFPRRGIEDPNAGFALLEVVHAWDPELPVLVQSADKDSLARATELGVLSVDKNSPKLHRSISDFLKESLGFGDFVFRLADRTEVARARNVFEMEEALKTVPAGSVEYHASRNHFSHWLMARSMFALAERLRPKTIVELGGVEQSRQHLVSVLRQARIDEQEGMITDFPQAGSESLFVRLGKGSIGGKARGIAFINTLLAREGSPRHPGIEIRTPRTVAIGTDEFDKFMDQNALLEELPRLVTDRELTERFLAARLPDDLARDLEIASRDIEGPLAVRSSSLLEDAQFQPFAGIYATYMLPNEHPDATVRMEELCRAVKAVYASTFSRNARAYLAGTAHSIEDEKMGVLIQQMVGQRHGTRFYPHISGVALSYNYYPMGPQHPDDGVVLVALGLGHLIVQGGRVLQFSPKTPGMLPQFPSPKDFLRHSQSSFYALDMSRNTVDFSKGPDASLALCDLDQAERDGTLHLVGSVYSAEDDVIRENLQAKGPRLVTFANVLRHGAMPLAPAVDALLKLVRHGIGCPVEMELAVDVKPGETPRLYVLQIRPQSHESGGPLADTEAFAAEDVFCRTGRSLGHGVVSGIHDVVWVTRTELDPQVAHEIVVAVGELNARLQAESRPYLLIGPGRWGSSDPRLGIPVEWSHIAGARVIVETSLSDRVVEPSQGSHFFHNMTAMQIGYLTVHPGTGDDEEVLDLAWLQRQPALQDGPSVRHVRLTEPLVAFLDGRLGRAVVLKPTPPPNQG